MRLALLVSFLASGLAAMEIGSNTTVNKWLPAKDASFTDIRNVTGADPWNPQFLKDMALYRCVRYLSWDVGHASTRKTWSQRPLKGDPNQELTAIEWCIDLSNRLGANMWMCTPHLTIDHATGDRPSDYALRLCLLVKTGVDMGAADLTPHLDRLATMSAADLIAAGGVRTCAPLRADLKLYIEYSNETWNGLFTQAKHCKQEGVALGLHRDATSTDIVAAATSSGGMDGEETGTPAKGPAGREHIAGWRFHAYAAIRNFRAADLVFGAGSPRVVRVLAQQKGALMQARQQQAVLANRRLNPWGVKADAIAIAPYFGSKIDKKPIDGASPDAPALMRRSIAEQAAMSAEMHRFAADNGLRLIAYEGGQHVTLNGEVINRQPVMQELYREYLAAMAPYYDLMCHFTNVGPYRKGKAFGTLEQTGAPAGQSPKYRALQEWSAAVKAAGKASRPNAGSPEQTREE